MSRKFWTRLGIIVFGTLILLYVVFWIALFNPLEGSVDRLDALIPKADVTWCVKGPWGEIRKSDLFKKHFLGSPLKAETEAAFELEQYLYEPVRQLESQVNASLPSFVGKFSVLEDIAGREVALAGRMTGEGQDLAQKALNSPYLFLTRISYKARFMEVLKYGAVRDNVPGLTAYRDFYEYDLGEQSIREGAPESARYVYFQRVKDALIFSNNRDLMEKAVHLGRAGGLSDESLARDSWFYYDQLGPTPEKSVLLWGRLSRMDAELGRELSGAAELREGRFSDFLRALFPVGRTISVTLKSGIEGDSTLKLRGNVRLSDSIDPALSGVHRTMGRDFEKTLADWVPYFPEERAFALLYLKMAPQDFFSQMLPAAGKGFEQGFLGRPDDGAPARDRWDTDRVATQLGGWFKEGVGIACTRLPEVERIDLDNWEGGSSVPFPGITLTMEVKDNLEPEGLIDFFTRNDDQFAFQPPREVEAPVGRMFVLDVTTDVRWKLLRPAFAIVDHQFLFCTNATELGRILAVRAEERPSLDDNPNYHEALAADAPSGNIFLFLDVERAMPFLYDQRYEYAYDAALFNEKKFRDSVIIRLARENPRWGLEKRNEAADRELDRRWSQAKQVDFPDAIRRYRNNMIWFEALRWITLSTAPGNDPAGQVRVDLEGAIRLKPIGE